MNKADVLAVVHAKRAGCKEKYLEIYMPSGTRRVDPTYSLMEKKFAEKFAGWKVSFLSSAEKLTLIKSTLTSLPAYHMSVAALPAKTTTKLTTLLRKFMWRKLDKERYLALVCWEKVCRTKEKRGSK
jgi:hypothetical protein